MILVHSHHSCRLEGRDKNFAGLLPIWDVVFGTYYLPDRPPLELGIHDQTFPERSFWGQVLYPFRRSREAVEDNSLTTN